ncbi:10879_t:CDS:2, partial [Ambispora gerdemannii]
VRKASSQKTEAEIPNVFSLLPLVINKIALSEFSENINNLFKQSKSNLFVSPPLATNTTLITAILKTSNSMSSFQKYRKIKHPTLLVMKGDTSNVDNNDSINHVNKNTELEMIISIKSGNIKDIKEDMMNGQDTNNVDNNNSINCVDNNRKLDEMVTCIIFTNKDDYKKAIITEVKDDESDNNNNMMLVIDRNDEFDDYKKAIIAKIKNGESDNNDNITLIIDGNDKSNNIKDTKKDMINEQNTNNVNNNNSIINHPFKKRIDEIVTYIIFINEDDYKKAIITEVKDDKSDNNDNMTLVIDRNDESDNIEDTEKNMINGQDTNNIDDNDIINENDESDNIEDMTNRQDTSNVDDNDSKNTKLEMITYIISMNQDNYKKAIITEIKDDVSDNNNKNDVSNQ